MTCCGQRPKTPPQAPATPAAAIKATPSGRRATIREPKMITIQYLRIPAIIVRGHATGRRYVFSGGSPVQTIDARDAIPLLRTNLFS